MFWETAWYPLRQKTNHFCLFFVLICVLIQLRTSRTELLSYLLPKTVNFAFFSAFLESAAGEHAARMAAMDSATTNANKLIDLNTTLRNRARQAQITTELTEIVAGAESLK